MSSIFSAHNRMKLEINHRKKDGEKNNYMKTKQHPTRKTNKSMRKSQNISRQMTMKKTQPYKNLQDAAKVVQRGKFMIQAFLKKQVISQIIYPTI